jgi:hypothetical protein
VKKILYILFAIIYLFLSTGISIATHFCEKEIYSVSFAASHNLNEVDGCCDNECFSSNCETVYSLVKINDSQKVEAAKEINLLQNASLPRYFFNNVKNNSSKRAYLYKINQFLHGSSICVNNCIFLI